MKRLTTSQRPQLLVARRGRSSGTPYRRWLIYNPEDPTYSGIEAVYDPGVTWVFTGFALICLGVFYMFYVEPRLKRSAAAKA